MKRFYKDVTAVPAETGGFRICLDGRPVKTPGRVDMICPDVRIAEIVSAEWRAQDKTIDPQTMPATQLINTMVDKFPGHRDEMTAQVLKFMDTDLICYTADGPEDLARIQDKLWGGARDWFEGRYGVSLKTTTDLKAIRQEAVVHKAVAEDIAALKDVEFIVFQSLVPVCGSVILSLGFVHGYLDTPAMLAAIFAEEDYQATVTRADLYGEDPMIMKKKTALRRDMDAAKALLSGA